jgi:hypothetical protein
MRVATIILVLILGSPVSARIAPFAIKGIDSSGKTDPVPVRAPRTWTSNTIGSKGALGAAPINDECFQAIELFPNATCDLEYFTIAEATQSLAGVLCNGAADIDAGDIWFRFTATAASLAIHVEGGLGIDPVIDLRSGACEGTSIACADETAIDGTEQIDALGLIVGQSYLIRVYDFFSPGEFDDPTIAICITSLAAQPPNDDCVNAIELFQTSSCEPITFSSQGATQSLAGISCNGYTGNANDDVWFSFIPTSPIAVIDVLGSSGYDAVVQLFTSGDCSGSTSYICSDDSLAGETERIYYGSFAVGQTYFLRVYDYSGGPPATPTFDICIHFGGDPPANDDCADVLPVVVQVGETITFNGTTVGAVPPEGSTEPYVYHAFTLLTCADVSWDLCGTDPMFNTLPLSLVDCPALEELSVGMADYTVCDGDIWGVDHLALPAGTYYIPIPVDGGNYGDYTINLTANQCTVVATNDACDQAIVLPINTTCETISATTIGATQSAPPITCNGNTGSSNDDVWFTFQATSPNATIAVAGEANFDAVVELIGVGCEIPISLACADATIAGGNEGLVVNNLVPGTNYWVRIYHYWTEAPLGGFEICIVGDISTGIENGPSWSMSGGWNGSPFTIQWSMDPAPVQIEVLDMTGRSIWSGLYNMQTGPNTMEPLSASVASGNYLLLIDAGQGRSGQRFFLE